MCARISFVVVNDTVILPVREQQAQSCVHGIIIEVRLRYRDRIVVSLRDGVNQLWLVETPGERTIGSAVISFSERLRVVIVITMP